MISLYKLDGHRVKPRTLTELIYRLLLSVLFLYILSCGSSGGPKGNSPGAEVPDPQNNEPPPIWLSTSLDTDSDGFINAYDADYLNTDIVIIGNGTQNSPYLLENIYQIQAIAGVDHTGVPLNASKYTNQRWLYGSNKSAQLGSVYRLFANIDIDASVTSGWRSISVNASMSNAGFTPIGECEVSINCASGGGYAFNGRFQGSAFKISNLFINRSEHLGIGMFGAIGPKGSVSLLTLEGASIVGGSRVGGIAGISHGHIVASSFEGKISGDYQTGGLVGENYGEISSSFGLGEISGRSHVGGIVGGNIGRIEYSYSEARVEGVNIVGGLVGRNQGTVFDSYTLSEVSFEESGGGEIGDGMSTNELGKSALPNQISASSTYSDAVILTDEFPYPANNYIGGNEIGGLIGLNARGGKIVNSYSAGTVHGGYKTGGLVGMNEEQAEIVSSNSISTTFAYYSVGGLAGDNQGQIFNSYSDNNVSGSYLVGGLIGNSTGTIEASYSLSSIRGNASVGGLVGYARSNITSSFAMTSIEGEDNLGGLVGTYQGSAGIYSSYALSEIKIKDGGRVGGLVGEHPHNFSTNSYWEFIRIRGLPSARSSAGVMLSLAQINLCRSEKIGVNNKSCEGLFMDDSWNSELSKDNVSVFWDFSDGESPPVLISRSLQPENNLPLIQCSFDAQKNCRANIVLSEVSNGFKFIRLVGPTIRGSNYRVQYEITQPKSDLFQIEGEHISFIRAAGKTDKGSYRLTVTALLEDKDRKQSPQQYSQTIIVSLIDRI